MIPIVTYSERDTRLHAILNRQAAFSPEVDASVRVILDRVRSEGDRALADFTEQFDGVRPAALRVSDEDRQAAYRNLDPAFLDILSEAAGNIRRFHEGQRRQSWFMEEGDGVILGQRVLPLERVGLYVPGGKAFYPSSLLMNAIPAQVAGVPEIHLVSPPGPNGLPHASVLATAQLLGLERIYSVGGAQAIAGLAYGTDTIPRVDKIVGPGNAYVAAAKKQVYGRVAIDSIAGPSEIVVLADAAADPEFVAADLLSQAEHDERASAILVTPSEALARNVRDQIERMVPRLSRRAIIEPSLADFGALVVTETMDQAVSMVNELAPEHLELLVLDPWALLPRIRHAGAVFLGPYSTEPVGDYFAGTNHVLPTGGTARYASALGVDDFVRKQSIVSYTRERLAATGPRIVRFAREEELTAHALAVQVRLDRESGD
ncbi:MAG: histidinol dehydrogenase [Rhodothermales bacterium]